MAHREKSGEGGVSSNSQSTYTTPNSLTNADIIESNKVMFSALTEVLQTTLTSMGNQLHEHSKCQMEQVNKLAEAVNQMNSSHNTIKMVARSTDDPKNSDNSDSGKDDEVNDGRNRITIHETDRSLYHESNLAASFLSHQETSSSSVTTTCNPEKDPIGSVFKEFSESYNQDNEDRGEPASEEVTKVVSVTFKETLSESAFENLLTKVILPENCKFAQAKLVNSVVFASVSPSIRSTDIKLQEVQRNLSKMTGCSINLLSELPNILKTDGDHKDEKLGVILTILDGIKMSGLANQNIVVIRKKFLLSSVSSEYKNLAKFAEDTDSHFHDLEEKLEDSLKKAKGRHYSLQALKPKPPVHASTKRKFNEASKSNRPTKRPMPGHKGTPQAQYNSPSTWAELKKTIQHKKPI